MHLVWVGVSLMAQNAPCKDRRRVWSSWLNIGLDLFCHFMDEGEVEVNENAKKRGHYPVILTEQTWSIKSSLHGQKHNLFLLGQSWRSREGKAHLPAKAVNKNTGFTLSCQLLDSVVLGTILTLYPAQLRNSQ